MIHELIILCLSLLSARVHSSSSSPRPPSTEPPTVQLRPSHHTLKAGTTMFLNLAAEGTPPPVFQWFRNGYPVPGLTGMALLMEDVNSSHSGTYSCAVRNIAGEFVWLEASVLVVD